MTSVYDFILKKSEEDRLNESPRKLTGGMSAEEAAATVAPSPGKAFEIPVDVLRELDQYIAKGKTMQNVKDAMDVLLQMLQGKETEQVPSIEFLPQRKVFVFDRVFGADVGQEGASEYVTESVKSFMNGLNVADFWW